MSRFPQSPSVTHYEQAIRRDERQRVRENRRRRERAEQITALRAEVVPGSQSWVTAPTHNHPSVPPLPVN